MRTWLARLRPRSIYDVMAVIGCVAAVGTGTAYAANTVFSTDIVDGEVKHADIAGNAVTSTNIYNGSVLGPEIHDDAVTSDKVAAATLTASDLATDSVSSSEIQTDAVGATEVADDTIDGGEIVNQSLGSQDLATNAITADELTNNVVTSGKVANNSLTTADVAGTDSNGSISLGAGSVANGRCKSYDITVGGAKTNETLIISARATLPAGLLIYGQRVPADGHGTMTVCNLSGATMPALTDFPIRTVTFG
jgi:hypothetical protein